MACGAGSVASACTTDLDTAARSIAIPTIRVVAADLAARADFDLDSIEDLRIAVDEACMLLVRIAASDTRLRCRFTVRPERIELAAEVDICGVDQPLPVGSLGWRVLNCLADEVNALVVPPGSNEHGRVCIALTKNRVTT